MWAKGGKNQSRTWDARAYTFSMTQGLHRYYGARQLHFILLGTARRRNLGTDGMFPVNPTYSPSGGWDPPIRGFFGYARGAPSRGSVAPWIGMLD